MLVDRLRVFGDRDVQKEGWLQGELLFLLDNLLRAKIIQGFGQEVDHPDLGSRRVDLQMTLSDSVHYIELKHVSNSAVGTIPLFGYGQELNKDVKKLSLIPDANRWVLVLRTPNPGSKEWQEGVSGVGYHLPCKIVSHSDPDDFSERYFLGLLEVLPVCEGTHTQ